MAKNGGGFNRVLNFIGLVDEPDQRGQANYAGGYNRPSTYVPQQHNSRTEETRKRMVVRDERGYDARDGRRPAQAASARRAPARGDYQPRPEIRSSRFGSYTPPEPAPAPAPRAERPAKAASSRQRTLMCALTTLEDCCDVIDSLIAGNVVVLTMDDLDPKLTQRAVDTLSGAVFALNATIRKASEKTYVIAPSTVEVNETYDVERRF